MSRGRASVRRVRIPMERWPPLCMTMLDWDVGVGVKVEVKLEVEFGTAYSVGKGKVSRWILVLRTSSTVRTEATIPAESMTFGAYRRTSSVSTYDSTPSLPIASIKVPKCVWLSLCRSCSTVSSSTWLRPQNLVRPRRVIDRLSYGAQSSAMPRSLLPNALMRGRGKAKANGAEKVEKQKLRRCGLPVGFNLRTPECCHRVLGSSLHLAAGRHSL